MSETENIRLDRLEGDYKELKDKVEEQEEKAHKCQLRQPKEYLCTSNDPKKNPLNRIEHVETVYRILVGILVFGLLLLSYLDHAKKWVER